jgi:hypothetical protein
MGRAESFVERQIREAEARGAFDDLPGKGKPIPGIDRQRRDGEWLAAYAEREQLPVSAMLPVSLALAKEVEDLPGTVGRQRQEHRVRAIVVDLNERIREAHRSFLGGPPLRVRPVDVEAVVADWQRGRR